MSKFIFEVTVIHGKQIEGNRLNRIKVTMFIQVLNSFISGVLSIVLPLAMRERNIEIATIGLIFASLPMIFQLARIFFAVLSDFLGRKLFFILNGLLSVISNAVYYFAYTPLQFVFGKVTEGTKSAAIWAVNRPFLLEESEDKRKALVHLRAFVYISTAVGSLLAGFLIVWLFYPNTLMLCILLGAVVVPVSLLLTNSKKKSFSLRQAMSYLDLKNKGRMFTLFLLLFLMMGLSQGFRSGYVFPLFLDENRFDAETIGVLIGTQTLLAGLTSYMFTKKMRIERLILLSGFLYSALLLLLGFSNGLSAAILIVILGVVDGLVSGGQEGILFKIAKKESYGTDIGLLMIGIHGGTTISLALSGFLISSWGFLAPFLFSALVFVAFYAPAYTLLKQQKPL